MRKPPVPKAIETNKQRISPLSLYAFLTRLIWLCVLPLVILAMYLAVSHINALMDQRNQQAGNQAQNLATAIDHQIGAQIAALQMLADSPLMDDPPRINEFYNEARGFRENFGAHVILADLSKQMVFNTRVPFGTPLPKLPEPGGNAAAPAVLATGKPAVGDMFMGPVALKPLVSIGVPLVRDARMKFLLLCIIETDRFQQRLDEVALPPGWSLTVLDGKNEVMARRSPPETEDRSAEGSLPRRFVANSLSSHWSVVLEVPPGVYRTPVIRTALVLGAAILAFTLVSVLGGRLAGRRLAHLVGSLAEVKSPPVSRPIIAEIEAVRGRLADSAAAREAAEMKRLESEQRFRRLFDVAPVPMCFVNKDDRFVNSNARFRLTFGYGEEDVSNLFEWWQSAYPDPDYRRWAMQTWETAVRHARKDNTDIEPLEYRVTCKNGKVLTVVISGATIGDDLLATLFDVTDRKLAEDTLRNKEATLRGILNATNESIWQFSPDGFVLMANETALQRSGEPAGEIIGRHINDIIPKELAQSRLARLRDAVESRLPTEFEDQNSGILFHHILYPVLDSEGFVTSVAAFSRDITRRKLAQETLKSSAERLRLALNAAKAGIWEWDLKTNRNFWSDELWELYGLEPHSCEPSYENWRRRIHPADRERAEQIVKEAAQNGTELHAEWRVQGPDSEERWLLSLGRPICDDHGQSMRYIGIVMDITERKRAEIKLNESLQEKVALLKEVHHRVKNNLQIVASLLSMQAKRASNREAVDVLSDTRNRVRSMALLHEVLYRSGNLAHINFAVYVRDLLVHLLPSFGAISARVKVESNVAPVGLALEQALPCGLIINELVSNSLKHGFPEEHYGSVKVTLQPGEDQQLVLSVRDDGVGMPVGFDFAGTPTLGLKLVSNLTGQLGGQLTVEDPHPGGAAFTVVFPIPRDAVL